MSKPCKKCGGTIRYAGGNCKACASSNSKNRIETRTKEQLKEKSRIYREKYPQKVKEANKKSRLKNLEEYKLRRKIAYANNPEKEKLYAKQYSKDNPEYKRNYLTNNPEYSRIYKQNRRARERENGGKLSSNITKKLFELQRGLCACCGAKLLEDYQLDHIMPISLGGKNIDSNIQLLKSKCNREKHAKHPIDFMQSKGYLI